MGLFDDIYANIKEVIGGIEENAEKWEKEHKRRPDGRSSRDGRSGKVDRRPGGPSAAEKAALIAERKAEAERLRRALIRKTRRTVTKRADRLNKRLEGRLSILAVRRQHALNQITMQEAVLRAATSRGDTAGVKRARDLIAEFNGQLLSVEHDEATAYGLHRRGGAFDELTARFRISQGARAYSGRVLGDKQAVGVLLTPGKNGAMGDYDRAADLRDLYTHRMKTKAGEAGHAKEIQRTYVQDVAMAGQTPEWWDTEEGAQRAAAIFVVHAEEVHKHGVAVNQKVEQFWGKVHRLKVQAKTAASKGDLKRAERLAEKIVDMTSSKELGVLAAEWRALYGKTVVNPDGSVNTRRSATGLTWLYDAGVTYVTDNVKRRQNELLAYGPNKSALIEWQKAVDLSRANVQRELMTSAKVIYDPVLGQTRTQTFNEVLAEAEASGLTPEQYAAAARGFSMGQTVYKRAQETENDPVLSHVYRQLASLGVETQEDLKYSDTRVMVQQKVMPDARDAALAAWKTGKTYNPPGRDRIYQPSNYFENGDELGYTRADGSQVTRSTWVPIQYSDGSWERQPLWDSCSAKAVSGNTYLCPTEKAFEYLGPRATRQYEDSYQRWVEKRISDELGMDWKAEGVIGSLGVALQAAVVPLVNAPVIAMEEESGTRHGIEQGDISVFDPEDYGAQAAAVVQEWEKGGGVNPGVKYGLTDPERYQVDEKGVYFSHRDEKGVEVRIRSGQPLPVPSDFNWSPDGLIEPFWHDPYVDGAYLPFDPNYFQSENEWLAEERNHVPNPLALEQKAMYWDGQYRKNFYDAELKKLRPSRLHALFEGNEGEWKDIYVGKWADMEGMSWDQYILSHTWGLLTGTEVVRATYRKDGRVFEERSFGVDLPFDVVHGRVPVRWTMQSGDIVEKEIQGDIEAIGRALFAGEGGVTVELLNQAGRVFKFGNMADAANFVVELFGDVSNFIPALNWSKRGLNGIKAAVGAGRIADGTPLAKLAQGFGKGYDAITTHPDLYRLTGANSRDAKKALEIGNEQATLLFGRDLTGMLKHADGTPEGYARVMDAFVARIFEINPGLDPGVARRWAEDNLLNVIRNRGIHVNTHSDDMLKTQSELEQSEVVDNARELEIQMASDQRMKDIDEAAKDARSTMRKRAAREVKQNAIAKAEADRLAAAAPPPAAATPGSAAGRAEPPSAAPAPTRAARRAARPPAPLKQRPMTIKRRYTRRGVKRGQASREVTAEDLTREIDAEVARIEDLRRQAHGKPVGKERADLEAEMRGLVADRNALQVAQARIVRAEHALERVRARVDEARAARPGSRLERTKAVQQEIDNLLAEAGLATGGGLKAAEKAVRAARREYYAVDAELTRLHERLFTTTYPNVDHELVEAVREAQAYVQRRVDYARDVLRIADPEALYRLEHRSAREVNGFLNRQYLKSVDTPGVYTTSMATALKQLDRAGAGMSRAVTHIPAGVRREYSPTALTGSYDEGLRALEHEERLEWQAKVGTARIEQRSTGWNSGDGLVFPKLVEPPAGSLRDNPIVVSLLTVLRHSTDPREATNAYEELARIYQMEWDRFFAYADERYPTGYPYWAAGAYSGDQQVIMALRAENEAILRVHGMRQLGNETDHVLLVGDLTRASEPRLVYVTEADYLLSPRVAATEDLALKAKREAAAGRAPYEPNARDYARSRAVEEATTEARPAPHEADFWVYDIGEDLEGFRSAEVGGKWYQPWEPYDRLDEVFKAPEGSAFDKMSREVLDLDAVKALDDDGLLELVVRIEDTASAQWTLRPGVLTYRRSTQPLFDMFHTLHNAVARSGDRAAFDALSRLHDIMSRRFLQVAEDTDEWRMPFIATYLMMESRVALPFSYPSDYMTAMFTKAVAQRGLLGHRAAQMVQHQYLPSAVMTPTDLNPAIWPLWTHGAGVKRGGELEGWAPLNQPAGALETGRVTVAVPGSARRVEGAWQSLYHRFTGTQRGKPLVDMVRKAVMLLETNTHHHGTWLASVQRLNMKPSVLRAAVLERGLHEMVGGAFSVNGAGVREVTQAGEARLRALYANFMREAGLDFDPIDGVFLLPDRFVAKVGGSGTATWDDLESLGFDMRDIPSFDQFVDSLGKTFGKHEATPGSMEFDPVGNPFGESRAKHPDGKYMTYGDGLGPHGPKLRTAWEKGIHGATGYAPIPASSPQEAVMLFLVHRGYWTDATRYTAATKRADMFLTEMRRFADELGQPDLYEDAGKLVEDLLEPSFAALRRRLLEQAGTDPRQARTLVRSMLGQTRFATTGKVGALVQTKESGEALGALYVKARQARTPGLTAKDIEDEIIEAHAREVERVKQIAHEEDWEGGGLSPAEAAKRDEEAFDTDVGGRPAYQEMAPTIDGLEAEWSEVSQFVGRPVSGPPQGRRPSDAEVQRHMVEWEARPGNAAPVHPDTLHIGKAVREGDPEAYARALDAQDRQRLIYNLWLDKRGAAERAFREVNLKAEDEVAAPLKRFIGRLVDLLAEGGLSDDDYVRLFGQAGEGASYVQAGTRKLDYKRGARGLVGEVQRALGPGTELEEGLVQMLAEAVRLHGSLGPYNVSAGQRIVRTARSAQVGGRLGRTVAQEDPVEVAGPLIASRAEEVAARLNADGTGWSYIEERRQFVRMWDAATPEELADAGPDVARELDAARDAVLDADRYQRFHITKPAVEEAVRAVDEARAAPPPAAGEPPVQDHVPTPSELRHADPSLSEDDAWALYDRLAAEREAAVRAGTAWSAPPVAGAPEPQVVPPAPESPAMDWVDAAGRTDGSPDPATMANEAGRDIWAALGMSELEYYYRLVWSARRELRGTLDDVRRSALETELDTLALAIYAVKRRTIKGGVPRRTMKQAKTLAERVSDRVKGVIPHRVMGYYATSRAGMEVEHYRSLWVRVQGARRAGRVAGPGLPKHVMDRFDPAHWDGLNRHVGDRIAEYQGRREASLGRTPLKGEREPLDEGNYVKTRRDADEALRRIVDEAISEYCEVAGIPVWDRELYWRVRTFLAPSQQRMRRGQALLDEAGGDMDEFKRLRADRADQEGVKQVQWLLMDDPLMTPEDAAELLALRFRTKGVIIAEDEVLTEADAFILEAMFKHYSGVTDVTDMDAVRAALQAHQTLPPWTSKAALRLYRETTGDWSPRTAEEVEAKGAWKLDDERLYWDLHFGEQPAWVADPRIDDGTMFLSRENYVNINREIGALDDAARIERSLAGGDVEVKLEDYIRGKEGGEFTIKRERDFEVERKWAIDRYGSRVWDGHQFTAMPWLMRPDEYVHYISKHGPVPGMIQTADEVYAVQRAMEDLSRKYVDYLMDIGVNPHIGEVAIDAGDVHQMAHWMAQQLLATTPWKKWYQRASPRGVLDFWGAFWSGLVTLNPAFTVSNSIDIRTRAALLGRSDRFARAGAKGTRGERAIPTTSAIGIDPETPFFYSKGGREAGERLAHPWSVADRVGGAWDLVTQGIARRYLGKIELDAKLRVARQLYDGYWDADAARLLGMGLSEQVVDLILKRRVAEQIRRMFPSLSDAGIAERMLNRLMPFISYNFKNKLLWTGWVLDHPWSIDLLQKGQEMIAEHNIREWERDHPGERIPDHLLHQIRIPGTDFFFDIGVFTDAARGASWATGTEDMNIGDFIHYWIRPLPQQDALVRKLVWDITGYGGKWVSRKVLVDGEWDGHTYEQAYVPPGTHWGDRPFDYINDMLPLSGARDVLGDALREGEITPDHVIRFIGTMVEFGEFGHVSETTELQREYYALQEIGYDKASDWLMNTKDGQRLKELWDQQYWDPDNPTLPFGTEGKLNEFQSLFYEVNDAGDVVFRAPDPKELRKRWLSLQPPELGDEMRAVRDGLGTLYASFDAELASIPWADEAARQELWRQRRAAESWYFAANPRYLQYAAFGKTPEEYEDWRAKSALDTERNEFFARFDWSKQPEDPAARKVWLQDKREFLEANPQFAASLANEASQWQHSLNLQQRAHELAIRASRDLEYVKGLSYRVDRPDLAEGVSALRDFAGQMYEAEAFGYDKEGQFRWKGDSSWRKYLGGEDPVKTWYPQLMSQIGERARNPDGSFNGAKWWGLVNQNPALRRQYMSEHDLSSLEWERVGQSNQFWQRWHSLADRGRPQDWERAWEMWDSAPAWLKEQFKAKSPAKFEKFQQDSQYSTYMGKWVSFFDRGDSAGAMRYFNSLPAWVRERYYGNHPGNMMSDGQHMVYVQTLDRMFSLMDRDEWDAAEKVWNSAPSWLRSWYINHNGKSPFEGGGKGGGIPDAQFRQYTDYMKHWVGLMKQGRDDEADRYFRSLPGWAKEFYLKRNPDKEILMLNDRLFTLAQDYFIADKEEQRAILARNPALAQWLREHDTKKARFDAINYIYSHLPDDPWLRRIYREKYPEVFSPEAAARRSRREIFDVLEDHPDLAKSFLQVYQHLAEGAEEALRWAEPRPEQPVLDRTALQQARRGMSAEDVALSTPLAVARQRQEREREPMAV